MEDPCYDRICALTEQCCPGSVCVDADGGIFYSALLSTMQMKNLNNKSCPSISVIGVCQYNVGQKQGELCRYDNDCETGLMCAEMAGTETRSCQPPVTSNKLYSK